MTLAPSDERVTFSQSEVATPRLRTTARRVLFWFIIALLVVAFGVATLVLTGGAQDKNRLSATNPHSNGAEAVIQVLKGDGVDVSTPATVTAAVALARRHPESTTVVVYDQDSILSTQQYRSLRSAASHVILVEPDSAALDALAPGVDHAGALASTVRSANCSDPAARAAGTVSGLARGYRVASGGDAVGCFGSDGVFAMVQVVNPTQDDHGARGDHPVHERLDPAARQRRPCASPVRREHPPGLVPADLRRLVGGAGRRHPEPALGAVGGRARGRRARRRRGLARASVRTCRRRTHAGLRASQRNTRGQIDGSTSDPPPARTPSTPCASEPSVGWLSCAGCRPERRVVEVIGAIVRTTGPLRDRRFAPCCSMPRPRPTRPACASPTTCACSKPTCERAVR